MAQQRLQKILAHAGAASRRQAEELISAGRVAVDGRVVAELGAKADPQTQRITLDGRPLRPERAEHWMVYKPVGVVSTAKDPQGRRRVVDLLPPESGRLYPVGRLDRDSEGLMLLTNHGELAHRLMHPRYQVPKTYRVWVEGAPTPQAVRRLREGVDIGDERPTAPARVYLKGAPGRRSKLSIQVREGRKREIRRMCEAVGLPVARLVRVGLGPLRLGEMEPGQARRLSRAEVAQLMAAVGLDEGCKPGRHGVKKAASRRRQARGSGRQGPRPDSRSRNKGR
jgi:pseudouridine synthase